MASTSQRTAYAYGEPSDYETSRYASVPTQEKKDVHIVPIRIVDQNQRWSLAEPPTQNLGDYRQYSRESLPEQNMGTTFDANDVIRRYIYDPVSMTHKEYLVNAPKRSSSRMSTSSPALPKIHEGLVFCLIFACLGNFKGL